MRSTDRAERMACVHLRRFPWVCHVLERPELGDRPGLVYREEEGRTRVLCATPDLERLGVRAGVTVADAGALARNPAVGDGGIEALVQDPVGERERLHALGETLLEFGPRVMVLPPDALVVEVGGSASLFGGEEAIARAMLRRLGGLGVPARAAVADGWHGARVLAEHGVGSGGARAPDVVLVPAGQEALAGALGPLPIRVLAAALGPHLEGGGRAVGATDGGDWPPARDERLFVERFVHALDLLGVRRCRELAALAEGDVAERWGPAGRALHRRARGEAEAPLVALRPTEGIREVLELDGACEDWSALLFHLGRLLARVAARLQARGELAARVSTEVLHHPDGYSEIVLDLARPTRDPKALLRLLRERLSGPDGGAGPKGGRGPITQATVVVGRTERSDGVQSDLVLAVERRGEDLADLVDRLRVLLVGPGPAGEGTPDAAPGRAGAGRADRAVEVDGSVFSAALTDRWGPGDEWERAPFPPPAGRGVPAEPGPDRPLAVLRRPEPLARWGAVVRRGPVERLCGQWWEDDGGFDLDLRRVVLADGRRVWAEWDRRSVDPHGGAYVIGLGD